jgi:hypothetical protein
MAVLSIHMLLSVNSAYFFGALTPFPPSSVICAFGFLVQIFAAVSALDDNPNFVPCSYITMTWYDVPIFLVLAGDAHIFRRNYIR